MYLVGAVERDHIGLDLILSVFGNAIVRAGRLKKRKRKVYKDNFPEQMKT